jgi:hypothetical protein
LLEGLGEVFGGAEAEGVNAGAAQGAIQFGKTLGIDGGIFVAHGSAVGVELEQFASLGVFEGQQAGPGQGAFARIMEVEADEVMTGIGQADFLEDIARPAGMGG